MTQMTPATPLFTRLQQDLNAARKAGDKAAVIVLGTTIADARNQEIQLRRELTDDDVVDVIRRAIKRRREAIELYLSAKRDDLVAKERSELATLEGYLPPQVDAEAIRAAVRNAIAREELSRQG